MVAKLKRRNQGVASELRFNNSVMGAGDINPSRHSSEIDLNSKLDQLEMERPNDEERIGKLKFTKEAVVVKTIE